VNERVTFVAAFGDTPKEEGTKKIARLLVEAIKYQRVIKESNKSSKGT